MPERIDCNNSEALGIAIEGVNVKGKTNEGLDAIGRGEGIAVHAVAQIRQAAIG